MKRISTEKEYNAIAKRIDELLTVVSDDNYYIVPEAIELDILSELIEDYETRYFPVAIPPLAEILRLRMFELDINQSQLANILHISPSRISEYLSGKVPTLQVAKTMYEKLNISANVIFGVYPNAKEYKTKKTAGIMLPA